ncbi:hypothetical protein GY45DRAFT_333093 [Cubamyces sp. BRFM 1775]|nr:hypothetical protein GY45DRAFT_333093 [Cubamyces sp. BRFM 1775]
MYWSSGFGLLVQIVLRDSWTENNPACLPRSEDDSCIASMEGTRRAHGKALPRYANRHELRRLTRRLLQAYAS